MKNYVAARFGIVALLVAFAAAFRLIPADYRPYNLAPVAAVALFAGACFDRARWAFVVPLAALLASDTILGYRAGDLSVAFHSTVPFTYASFVLIAALGIALRSRRRAGWIAGAALGSSVLFFLITNFGSWLVGTQASGLPYEKSLAGLLHCYQMGLPFFRATLLGDAVFTALLFGIFALADNRFPAAEPAAVAVTLPSRPR
jgi:hypothetical protein